MLLSLAIIALLSKNLVHSTSFESKTTDLFCQLLAHAKKLDVHFDQNVHPNHCIAIYKD